MESMKYIMRYHWQNLVLFILTSILIFLAYQFDCFKISDEQVIDTIAFNSVLSGFLFTALSIFISALSKSRIQRLMKYNYLDKYYWAIIISLVLSLLALVINFLFIYMNFQLFVNNLVISQKVVISLTIGSIIFFGQSIYYVVKLLKKMKVD